ncbi:hypothetical protein [Methylotenera sp.]|uniref:hypothetical protein n=1 Tax=Methylotenera sp. TaxID=2051956 RepID=UPI002734245E|nr:hypothetical protein [Methylotenera sp.]MDP3308280.1 hypothetical protein [Methylotenera sp.]
MCSITDNINSEIKRATEIIHTINIKLTEIDSAHRAARNELDTLSSALSGIMSQAARLPARVDAAAAVRQATVAEQITAMLSGDYKLRTIQAVTDATGLSQHNIEEVLDNAGIDAVYVARKRDGAPLIGLASRN